MKSWGPLCVCEVALYEGPETFVPARELSSLHADSVQQAGRSWGKPGSRAGKVSENVSVCACVHAHVYGARGKLGATCPSSLPPSWAAACAK